MSSSPTHVSKKDDPHFRDDRDERRTVWALFPPALRFHSPLYPGCGAPRMRCTTKMRCIKDVRLRRLGDVYYLGHTLLCSSSYAYRSNLHNTMRVSPRETGRIRGESSLPLCVPLCALLFFT